MAFLHSHMLLAIVTDKIKNHLHLKPLKKNHAISTLRISHLLFIIWLWSSNVFNPKQCPLDKIKLKMKIWWEIKSRKRNRDHNKVGQSIALFFYMLCFTSNGTTKIQTEYFSHIKHTESTDGGTNKKSDVISLEQTPQFWGVRGVTVTSSNHELSSDTS